MTPMTAQNSTYISLRDRSACFLRENHEARGGIVATMSTNVECFAAKKQVVIAGEEK